MDIKKFGHHVIDRLEPSEIMEVLRDVKVVVGVVPAKLDPERAILIGDDGIQVIPDTDMGNVHIERNRLGDRLAKSSTTVDEGSATESVTDEGSRSDRKQRSERSEREKKSKESTRK